MDLDELRDSYLIKKKAIEQRIEEFKSEKSEDDIFKELAFCLLTPQSKAKACWNAIMKMDKIDDLSKVRPCLVGVRFADKKAEYLLNAKSIFSKVLEKIRTHEPEELRNYLVENVKGFGYKEASHFLRNIGFVDFAILDRHVLKNLKSLAVIEEIPNSLTRKRYMEIEEKMKKFAADVEIPVSHLDLLLWSNETGEIFK